jgi:ligand-binding SRPBCC domain-containing protein
MAATTFRLRVWTRYFSTVDEVWAVKTDPACIAAELRPFVQLSAEDADGLIEAVRAGRPMRSDARLLPFGVDWPIELSESVPGEFFKGTTTNAIFSRFEHTHTFQPTSDGCRYVDDVVFTPALPAAKMIAILTRRLFVHRHRVAAERLSPDGRTVGTSVLRVLLEEDEDFGMG